MNRGTSNMRKALIVANIVILLGLAGSTGYLFFKNRDLNDQITLTTEEKNKRLIDEINKVFDLPEEEPVVAIVTDVEEFKKQYSTFDNAETGDYLLFFRKARLNVLYRQSEKRVVKTANVVVPISVELVGTQVAIDEATKKLSQFGDQISITSKVVDGITQSFVFDVDADQSAEAQSIADLLKYEIGSTLPSSITPADQTEIVIAVVAGQLENEIIEEPVSP
jgi:hypothetical protein